MKKITIIIFLILINVSFAEVLKLEPSKGQVAYLAKGRPAFISIKGMGEGVAGEIIEKDGLLSGEINFNLSSLKSGIELRDDHLKNKYLEIEKFPKAILKIMDLKIPVHANDELPFEGSLTLHGVEKKIQGTYSIKKSKQIELITAEFKINLKDFNIDIPSFQGITVAEDVIVNANLPISKSE